jgi:hypothetical protein
MTKVPVPSKETVISKIVENGHLYTTIGEKRYYLAYTYKHDSRNLADTMARHIRKLGMDVNVVPGLKSGYHVVVRFGKGND